MSPVIGMIFVLIIMLSVIIPVMYLVTSTPSNYEESYASVQPEMTKANEQLQEVNSPSSPIGFYYGSGVAYIVYYSEPMVPLNISYFLGYSGNDLKVIKADPTNTTYNGYPAIEYDIGDYTELAMVTSLGNIIYADPIVHYNSNVTDSTVSPIEMIAIQNYNSSTNPNKVVIDNPYSFDSHYVLNYCNINGLTGYYDVEIALMREQNSGWINLTIAGTKPFFGSSKADADTIGFYAPTDYGNIYGQIEWYSNSMLFNISYDGNPFNWYLCPHFYAGVYTSVQYNVIFPANIDFHFEGNELYVCIIHDGKELELPNLNLANVKLYANPDYSPYPTNVPFTPVYVANYSTQIWVPNLRSGYYITTSVTMSNSFPFSPIQMEAYSKPSGDAQLFCYYYPVNNDYVPIPIGAPIEIFIGNGMILSDVQASI
ncbi:hypothetical protein [Acidianus manzaensis]|uniref:Uncharacterized protein n=1 Tax=Acidianus manzaensis TaxID=282676 RepID=A0A1W6JXP5_9CREN|nr:hypothetical protein [Acidianus manzaensis]ARM75046.1 hypothetical protein B6F84_02715 [Acidianus manzaensis]